MRQLEGARRERDNAQKAARDSATEVEGMRRTLGQVTAERYEATRDMAVARQTSESHAAELESVRTAVEPLAGLLFSPEDRLPTLLGVLSSAKARVERFAEVGAFLGCRRALAIPKS
jgi:chromosome segregation ATPase